LLEMSFSVRLSSDLIAVDAGSNTPLTLEVANRADEEDQFQIEIEGIDPEWTALPVPMFSVAAEEVHSEKIFFRPGRASESLAGNYPFVVKVRSLNSGETRTVQGVLQIKPFHHLSMEIFPKRGTYSPWSKQNLFQITIMNLGNSEHTLQLVGNDPDEATAFEFEHEQVVVGPGQQKAVDVEVVPTNARLFSGARLYGISISGRSIETPSVVASAQAQLEQRPLLAPGMLIVLLMALVLGALWFAFLPKPPQMDSLTIDPVEVVAGQPLTVSWTSSHARRVRISYGQKLLNELASPSGSLTFIPDESGEIEAVAIRDDKTSAAIRRSFTVQVPEPTPAPKIVQFDIKPRNVKLGETFVVTYRVENATRAFLSPPGEELSLAVAQRELTAQRTGNIDYTLVVENAAGKRVQQTIRVAVTEEPDVRIITFNVTPQKVTPEEPRVTVTWQLTGAATASLSDGVQTVPVDATGTLEFTVTQTTTFTITGFDAKGRTVVRSVKVEYVPPPDDVTTGSTTGDPSTGGGMTAGGTTR
jgi:hypothetical protein